MHVAEVRTLCYVVHGGRKYVVPGARPIMRLLNRRRLLTQEHMAFLGAQLLRLRERAAAPLEDA